MSIMKDLFDIAKDIGFIQAMKSKLMLQPDPAADKLVAVLGELSKVYGACQAELMKYLSLSFDPAGANAEERAVLLTLESGQLWIRASEASGHCHKISNINKTYLQPWFHKVLESDEADKMEGLFNRLSYADSQMDAAITELTNWLTKEAQETLDLVDAGKYEEANQRVKAARKEILDTLQAISKAMRDLVELQGEFIAASGTV
jgi:hypothetical protein